MADCEAVYKVMTCETLKTYVTALPALQGKLRAPLEVTEIGDGNLNLVFLVKGADETQEAYIIKQALPYVRCVGEGWPLTKDRIYFEHESLVQAGIACPKHSPEIYHFDHQLSIMVMQYLKPPMAILRASLIAGTMFPEMVDHMSTFLSQTLFNSSALHLDGPSLREQVSKWSKNSPLCALTEQVVFTDPYIATDTAFPNKNNPVLDDAVKDMRSDFALKLAVMDLKEKFISKTQALVHGDLHTGSVMASEDRTVVIDSEFAFYGPMGFDIGAFIANLLLCYCAEPGHGNKPEYREWLLAQVVGLWESFAAKFIRLWDAESKPGESYSRKLFAPDEYKTVQSQYMATLLWETLGFAGCKMVRRVVGVAHVEDLDSISDDKTKGECEARALAIGRMLITNAGSYTDMNAARGAIKAAVQ
jgi:5-methylthioribose kinase